MRRAAFTVLCLFAVVDAHAQSSSDYVVNMVTDRRTDGSFANLSINLELPRIKRAEVAAQRVTVAAATCDTGTSVLSPEAGGEFQNNMPGYGDSPMTVEVTLVNPPRKAKKLTEVRGEIQLAMPSRDPNSVASVARFLSFDGKPLSHKALKASGVEVAMVSRAQISAANKKALDAKREELKGEGYEGESLDAMVNAHEQMLFTPDEGDIVLKVKDPKKAIRQISYVDGKGERQMLSSSDREEYVVLSTWGDKPQKDWALRFDLNTEKSIKRIPFVLKDVPLP